MTLSHLRENCIVYIWSTIIPALLHVECSNKLSAHLAVHISATYVLVEIFQRSFFLLLVIKQHYILLFVGLKLGVSMVEELILVAVYNYKYAIY